MERRAAPGFTAAEVEPLVADKLGVRAEDEDPFELERGLGRGAGLVQKGEGLSRKRSASPWARARSFAARAARTAPRRDGGRRSRQERVHALELDEIKPHVTILP